MGPGRLHHQTARSYCFVPPLKPSPLRGEGVTADAVTDEGSSYSRLCSSHGTCQRGSALRGWFLSERPERNQRDAGERSRRDHGSTCVPPGARSPLSPGPPMRETRALGMAPASGAGGGRHTVPPFALPPLVCPMGIHTPRWCRAWIGRIGAAGAKSAGAQKLKISPRRGGFQPPEKPSPLRGEGVTAYAVTDEGSSSPIPAAGWPPKGSALRGGWRARKARPYAKAEGHPVGAASRAAPKAFPPPGGRCHGACRDG